MSEEREPAFNPDAGEHVESAACRLLAMARERNAEVFCLFNDTRMTARPGMLLEEVLDGWSEGRRRTNETTPDAVEAALCKMYRIIVCDYGTFSDMTVTATLALEGFLAERARHAEEVARLEAVHLSALETIEAWKLASGLECGGDPDGVTPAGMRRYWEGVEADRDSLRAQLRKVEGERDAERGHATEMEERALDLVRDLRLANVELTSLRSLLPDVRALARWAIETEHMSDHVNTDQIGDVGLRILAALDSQGGEGE